MRSTVTTRGATLLSGPITQVIMPCCAGMTALAGADSMRRLTSTVSATSTAWPGQSTSSAFSAVTLTAMAPVCLSTWLSMKAMVAGTAMRWEPGTTTSAVAFAASARRTAGSSRCGRENATRIGRVWLMVTRAAASCARTCVPSLAARPPVRPVMGARMVR